MRKENMITRTITSTVYTVMCVDVTKGEVITKEVTLSGEGLSDDKALKKIKSIIEGVTPVAIQDRQVITNLYGMSDTEFMKYARLLKEGGR